MVELNGLPWLSTSEAAGLRWIHIESPRTADRDWLEEHFDFTALDYEDVYSRNQRPKLDQYDDYVFMVLHFPLFEKESGRIVTVSFRGPGPDGVPGEIVHTFSDFRPAGGLTMPYKQSTTINGEPSATATTTKASVNEPVDEALWKRKGATP